MTGCLVSAPGFVSFLTATVSTNQPSNSFSFRLKMAANAGSMCQYWKRFDLQQLQVNVFCSEPSCLGEDSCELTHEALRMCLHCFLVTWRHSLESSSRIDRDGFLPDQKLIPFVQFPSIIWRLHSSAGIWAVYVFGSSGDVWHAATCQLDAGNFLSCGGCHVCNSLCEIWGKLKCVCASNVTGVVMTANVLPQTRVSIDVRSHCYSKQRRQDINNNVTRIARIWNLNSAHFCLTLLLFKEFYVPLL